MENSSKKIVLIGFFLGISLTLFVSTNFDDIISVRIAIGSGLAFFIAQNIDVNIFDFLRKKLGTLRLYHLHLQVL